MSLDDVVGSEKCCVTVSGKKLPQERNEVTRNLSRPVRKNKKSTEENVVDNCPFHDPNSV